MTDKQIARHRLYQACAFALSVKYLDGAIEDYHDAIVAATKVEYEAKLVELPSIAKRITQYLSAGGLFNPARMEHEKVRDLLLDCRAAIATTHAEYEAKLADYMAFADQSTVIAQQHVARSYAIEAAFDSFLVILAPHLAPEFGAALNTLAEAIYADQAPRETVK